MNEGIEEGAVCGRDGCEGVIVFQKPENCSCHIVAPCGACENVKLWCPNCGWDDSEEILVCLENTGLESAFDVGIEYVGERCDDKTVYVWNKEGRRLKLGRFRFEKVG